MKTIFIFHTERGYDMELKKNVDIAVEITPEEVAKLFCDMNSREQAVFFNSVYDQTLKWDRPFCFQLQSIIEEDVLRISGKNIMSQIGEYGDSV